MFHKGKWTIPEVGVNKRTEVTWQHNKLPAISFRLLYKGSRFPIFCRYRKSLIRRVIIIECKKKRNDFKIIQAILKSVKETDTILKFTDESKFRWSLF